MKLSELRASFRNKAGDKTAPYFWSDSEVDGYINEAIHESVDRGLMIFDRDSFSVSVVPDTTMYPLDSKIIRVVEANVVSKNGVDLDRPVPLPLSDRNADFTYQQFFDLQGYRISEDMMLILATPPLDEFVVDLVVYRYPTPLVGDNDEPEIDEAYQEKSLAWALKLATLKQDADTVSEITSDKWDAEFTRTFGPPKTAQQHRQCKRRFARSRKTPGF